MSVMSKEQDVEKLTRRARKVVKNIFKAHGLSSYRRVGLQKTIEQELVKTAILGNIDIVEKV